jgi:SAM-dependent methyltransferase
MDKCEPSALVRRFGSKIAAAAVDKPIVDVACGSGRNAIFLATLGCTVICVDRDLTRLPKQKSPLRLSRKLIFRQMDLAKDSWPFGPRSVGGIINVHFLLPKLLPLFHRSLSPGGYLLVETVPGHGGNYLELPKAQELRIALEKGFDIELYRETKVGPTNYDAVTVFQLWVIKRSPSVYLRDG